MELSLGNGLTSVAWVANTPVHMRNGGWDGQTPASPPLTGPNRGGPGTGTCAQDAGTVIVTDAGNPNDAGTSPEAGQPGAAPDDGGLPPLSVDAGPTETDPNTVEPAPVKGGCSAAPGMLLLGLIAWTRPRRRV